MGRGWGAAGTSHSSGPDWSLKSITEMPIPTAELGDHRPQARSRCAGGGPRATQHLY